MKQRKQYQFDETKYKGIIFIIRIAEEEASRKNAPCYAGYRFENYVKKLNENDTGEKYYTVKGETGDHTLLYKSEIDCIISRLEGEPTLGNIVELKTGIHDRRYSDQPSDFFKRTIS